MGISIACCIVAYVNWDFANSWDYTQKNASNIYRVQFHREFQGNFERYGAPPVPMGNLIKGNFSDVSKVVRYYPSGSNIRIGDEVFNTSFSYADSAFFDLFTYELKYGTFSEFHNKSNVFISDELAIKYFGKEDVVGEQITQIYTNKENERILKEFTIGGVFKQQPYNSSFRFEAITLFSNFWETVTDPWLAETSWKRWTALFLKIDDPSLVSSVEKQLQQFIEPQNLAREDFKVTSYYLQPFVGMMKENRKNPRVGMEWLRGGIPNEAITVPSIMAAMLLLLACFNFTNTSISISSKRLKEIGIRKVMGGLRRQLMFQFLGESLFLCFLGLAIGLLIAEWMVPAYDSLWGFLNFDFHYADHLEFLLFLVGLLIATALLAGSYPAFYITSFEPVSILKGNARFGGTSWFTRFLLGGQFFISLLSIIMGVAFYENGKYQKNYDLGFNTYGVISCWVNSENDYNALRNALSDNKDIMAMAGTKHHVANSWYNDPIKFESLEREVDIMEVGDEYMNVMDMTIVNGRNFIQDSETDHHESVIVTQALVDKFGWKDNPIGQRLVWMDTVHFYVVGVIKNVYARALWEPVQPLMIRYSPKSDYQQLVIKADVKNILGVDKYVQEKWKEVFPNTLYNGQFIDEEMRETNEINANVVLMFGFLGFFAALMTGIGLYTLVSLNIVKRMKEIGVRKVLGASITNITGVINREFIINLAIATVLGGTAGYFAANWLMDTIWEYFLKLNLVGLSISIVCMVAIAVLSVGYKSFTTAKMNPVKTLRDE